MCVIAYKPAGVEFPSEDVIRECFISNPDGAGVMFPHMGRVRYKKGFMSVRDFLPYYEKLQRTVGKDVPVAMHFRIGTHGIKCAPTHCHPFPIVYDYEIMTKLEGTYDVVGMHNGIISGFGYQNFSDTMSFFALVLDAFKRNELIGNPVVDKIIKNLAGTYNKFLLMNGEGKVDMHGSFEEDKGVFYSNTSYKPFDYSYSSYGKNSTATTVGTKTHGSLVDITDMRRCTAGEYYRPYYSNAPFIKIFDTYAYYTDEFNVYSSAGHNIGTLETPSEAEIEVMEQYED